MERRLVKDTHLHLAARQCRIQRVGDDAAAKVAAYLNALYEPDAEDDRDLHDYEICDICGCRMTWTAAQPYGDALACDDCIRKGAPMTH